MIEQERLFGIGQRLRMQRKKMQLSQEKAAELLDMSVTYYGNIERGKKSLSLEKILLVYTKMKLPPHYLLLGKGVADPEAMLRVEACTEETIDSLKSIILYLYELLLYLKYQSEK